ncbi:MAG: DoxX family protein [Salegentibacter sp.]
MTKISVTNRSAKLFRVMLSGIFIVAGGSHLLKLEKTLQRIEQARFKGIAHFFGEPRLLVILSGVAMVLAGIGLLMGFKTRYSAGILAMILIPITLTIQVGQITTLGPLYKNIAILGGLLFFILNDFSNTQKQKL